MSTEPADRPPTQTMDNLDTGILSLEDLEIKHKNERKTLQANIMQLKKAVPKGDKKRLKEMQQQVIQMEADFEKKCNIELNEIHNRNTAANNSTITGLAENGDAEVDEEKVEGGDDTGLKKVSKAEKRREKKRQMELERDRRIAEDNKQSETRPRAIENELLNEKLAQKKLRIYEIAADGNCLFNAIVHQLAARYGVMYPVMEVRRRCADYLRQNREEFEPFLDESEDFDKYCTFMEKDQSRWGGHLELKAISQAMALRITVYQAEGPCIEFGDDANGPERHLHLSYHRKLISTGEHYNSAIDIPPGGPDGDFIDEAAQK